MGTHHKFDNMGDTNSLGVSDEQDPQTPPSAIPSRLQGLARMASAAIIAPGREGELQEEVVNRMWSLMGLLYKPHPWHGVSIGKDAPHIVTSFIEIVPGMANVKLEIDKRTGYLKVDRPNEFSSVAPVWPSCAPRPPGLRSTVTTILLTSASCLRRQ